MSEMENLMERFPHIVEEILTKLDNSSLSNCRLVNKALLEFINQRNYVWIRIVNIPTVLKNGNSYLHVAAKSGQTQMFEIIANERANKNPKNHWRITPLHLICEFGHLKLAKLLVENYVSWNIDFNSRNDREKTSLYLACYHGHAQIVDLFMQNIVGLKINLTDEIQGLPKGWTYFHLACYAGHLDVVKVFLRYAKDLKINLDVRDKYGSTPFCYACMYGHSEIAKLLIKHSFDLNININNKSTHNSTALHEACWN